MNTEIDNDKIESRIKECDNKLDSIFNDRLELFKNLNVSDLDNQKHIVDLIHNVVHEREISLYKTSKQLEKSFTPELKEMLNEKFNK